MCCHLDGIPLAIELAAARARSLSIEDIDGRLDRRFRLLTGGSRTALPRQQTLRSMIDWSYDLLSEKEERLFERLSVFAGGWTLGTAEGICAGEGVEGEEVLDLLTSLVDKSLVVSDASDRGARYRLLETVRQYARDRLFESGEGELWRDRHLAHFLALAEETEPQLIGSDQAEWLTRLEVEHDNLQAALAWCEADRDEAGLRLVGALWRFWDGCGYIGMGRAYLSDARARESASGRTDARAKALDGAGFLAYCQGDYQAAGALYEEALSIRRELGGPRGIARTLSCLGMLAAMRRDYRVAQSLYEESLSTVRELGDKRGIAVMLINMANMARDKADYAAAKSMLQESLPMLREIKDDYCIAVSLNNLGCLAYIEGDYDAARALCTEALSIRRELGDKSGVADSVSSLGTVARNQGDYGAAKALPHEGLSIRRDLGERPVIVGSLDEFAAHAIAEGRPKRAARLLSAAEALRVALGNHERERFDRERHDRDVAATRVAPGDVAFSSAWAEGHALTLEEAIDLALSEDGG